MEKDTLTGGAGNDLFIFKGTDADDKIITDLGTGSDNFTLDSNVTGGVTATVSANYTATVATFNNALTADAVISGSGFDVNMAAVTNGSNGFTINGTAAAASLTGSALADAITGGTAADSITGGAGNDVLTGAGGQDTINASGGTDALVQILNGTAAVITTIQNFDVGTAATAVDTYSMATLVELNGFIGSNAGGTAIASMTTGNDAAAQLAAGTVVLEVLAADDTTLGGSY